MPVPPPQLILVMPVYNEEAAIAPVVREWLHALDQLDVPAHLRVHNDGSTDRTTAQLDALQHPRLEIIHAQNRGHGPAILAEYRRAARHAPWVFQTDSDGEIPPSALPQFWAQRHHADLVIGLRIHRRAPPSRRLLTTALRLLLRLRCGPGIRDPNCPCRLLRSHAFLHALDQMPDDSFAPNALLSAHALRHRLRIRQLPIPFTPRTTGQPSIRRLALLRAALLSTRQTLRFLRQT